jgi:hypothetical protein
MKMIEFALPLRLGNKSFLSIVDKRSASIHWEWCKNLINWEGSTSTLTSQYIGCVDKNLYYDRALVGDLKQTELKLIEQNDTRYNFIEMLYGTTMGRINSLLRWWGSWHGGMKNASASIEFDETNIISGCAQSCEG